jgi:hypothetical protein
MAVRMHTAKKEKETTKIKDPLQCSRATHKIVVIEKYFSTVGQPKILVFCRLFDGEISFRCPSIGTIL